MLRSPLIVVLAMCLFVAAGRASAQDKIDKQIADLEIVKANFVKDKEAAKKKVLNQFDALIQQVMKAKLGAAERLSLADKLRAERKVFAEKQDLPENSDVLPAAWQYGTAVVKKYKPVSTKFDHVMSACIKAGKVDQAELIKSDKEKFDNEHTPGRKNFVAGATWNGTQYEGTSGSRFLFRVTELQGNVFKARVEKNAQAADISGSLDGILVQSASLTPVQGSVPFARCEGVVLGQTLILQLVTPQRKGLPTISFAVLRKK
jgi:hypothetical protein